MNTLFRLLILSFGVLVFNSAHATKIIHNKQNLNSVEPEVQAHTKSLIQRLLASRGREPEVWLKMWLEAKNETQQMLLLALSLSDIEDPAIGSFDRVLKKPVH